MVDEIHECPHGYTVYSGPWKVDSFGLSTCCAAFTSLHVDDGSEYCKCCYSTIDGYVEVKS